MCKYKKRQFHFPCVKIKNVGRKARRRLESRRKHRPSARSERHYAFPGVNIAIMSAVALGAAQGTVDSPLELLETGEAIGAVWRGSFSSRVGQRAMIPTLLGSPAETGAGV